MCTILNEGKVVVVFKISVKNMKGVYEHSHPPLIAPENSLTTKIYI